MNIPRLGHEVGCPPRQAERAGETDCAGNRIYPVLCASGAFLNAPAEQLRKAAEMAPTLLSIRMAAMNASVDTLLRSLRVGLAELLAPRPVLLAYLYGSAATGRTTPF